MELDINHLVLKKFREELGFSQTEFADLIGVAMRTYQNYEKEDKEIPKYIKKLIRYEIIAYRDDTNNNKLTDVSEPEHGYGMTLKEENAVLRAQNKLLEREIAHLKKQTEQFMTIIQKMK